VTEKKIKEEFMRFGSVIDYALKRKSSSSGNSGYVIMKSRTEAENAMRYINKQ
jgi:hypothetical protein